MLLARRLDRECIALQRQGELTVYPAFEGQEAAQVGSAFALGPDDFVFPTFRELAAALVRGVDPVAVPRSTTAARGTAARTTRARPGSAPICIPIATQIVARRRLRDGPAARRYRRRARSRTSATARASEGDFHEAANLAAVFGAPAILFCQNNGWAISVPTAPADGGRDLEARRGLRLPRRPRRRQRRARRVSGDEGGRRPCARGRRPDADRGA